MASIKDIFTKDIKPFKTAPLRRPGFSAGLSYCVATPLSILVYSLLNNLGITHVRIPIALPIILTYLIYKQWLSYAKSIHSKEKAQ